jgi:hypothetical protein
VNSPVELHPLYYQENFERLCETVWLQYEDLLLEREREFRACYEEAGQAARCLFIRLASRRGPLFRSEQLDYPELGNMERSLFECQEAGLLAVVDEPDPEALLDLLRKDEILAIYGEALAGMRSQRKGELVEKLLEMVEVPALLQQWRDWRGTQSQLLEVVYRDCVELFQLLFFGNRRQSLTEFVLSDLGVVRYWNYPLDPDHRQFEDRDQIDDYLQVAALREDYELAVAGGDLAELLVLVDPLLEQGASALLEQRRDRLRNRVARQLEREQAWEPALLLYACSSRHPARERRVRVMQQTGDLESALQLCESMMEEPWCEAELDFLRRQIPALRKKLGLDSQSRERDSFEEEKLVLASSQPVELAAASHYARHWEHVHYVENAVVNGLFGLAFWEQIFQSLPGAFVNPFQAAPLDMFSQDFYRRRRAELDRRLVELDSADLGAELLQAYDLYQDIANRWINWRYLSREIVEQAATLVPRAHWLAIFQRILFDPEVNRSGIPDLLALDRQRGYSFIEVKGPGDQLQLNQRRWLRFFQAQGIPARVAWVEWRDG